MAGGEWFRYQRLRSKPCRARYFAGMSEEDIAASLRISLATVGRDWRKARAFLYERLR